MGAGVDSGVVEDLPDRGRSDRVAEPSQFAVDCGGSPKSDSRLRGAVRVGEAPLPSVAGPAVAVVGSSVGRCGAGASATACRG